MVAEFRARMVGRVVILFEAVRDADSFPYDPEIDAQDQLDLDRSGATAAIQWVNARYPNVKLTKHSSERPDLVAHTERWFEASWSPAFRKGRNLYPYVLAIEFDDDQQATDFKLRWV